jgi:hypothetical protein
MIGERADTHETVHRSRGLGFEISALGLAVLDGGVNQVLVALLAGSGEDQRRVRGRILQVTGVISRCSTSHVEHRRHARSTIERTWGL